MRKNINPTHATSHIDYYSYLRPQSCDKYQKGVKIQNKTVIVICQFDK